MAHQQMDSCSRIRGLNQEHFATRDPVSGAAYYLLLMVFAIMPRLV